MKFTSINLFKVRRVSTFVEMKISDLLPHSPKMGGYINSKLNHAIFSTKDSQISEKRNQPLVISKSRYAKNKH